MRESSPEGFSLETLQSISQLFDYTSPPGRQNPAQKGPHLKQNTISQLFDYRTPLGATLVSWGFLGKA